MGDKTDGKELEYNSWRNMKARCLNPDNKDFVRYGARGIKVCDRWINSYECFLDDMGKRPTPKHSIGRINHDGDYDPLNCKWVTPIQQNRYKRTNKLTMADAREIRMLARRGYTYRELAEEFGTSKMNIKNVVTNRTWRCKGAQP